MVLPPVERDPGTKVNVRRGRPTSHSVWPRHLLYAIATPLAGAVRTVRTGVETPDMPCRCPWPTGAMPEIVLTPQDGSAASPGASRSTAPTRVRVATSTVAASHR